MKLYKQVTGAILATCVLAMACVAGAAEPVAQETMLAAAEGSTIDPMANKLVLDTPISKAGSSWYQEKGYTSYRVWVENTTQYKMTVTITEPSGKTRSFTVDAGKSGAYPVNGVPSGTYKLTFNTGGHEVSGTVRVRVSDMALS